MHGTEDPKRGLLMPGQVPVSPEDQQLLVEPVAPFRLDLTAWALRRRAHNRIDRWDGSTYRRAVSVHGGPVALSVSQNGRRDEPYLRVGLTGRPMDRRTEALARSALERLLGLTVDVSAFAEMAAQDPLLGPLADRMQGLKPPRFPTVFEALVNGIACQQLSLSVGIHLLNRLTTDYGQPAANDPDGPRAFPGPEELASTQVQRLNRHGFSAAKAHTIVETARAVVAGTLDLEGLEGLDDQEAMKLLTTLRGVGRWTAEYVLLRGLGRLHIFPGDDVGAHNKLRRFLGVEGPLGYERTERLVERWRPYAGMVYFHLLLDSLPDATQGPASFHSETRKKLSRRRLS